MIKQAHYLLHTEMKKENFQDQIEKLRAVFEGEILLDETNRILYATDASAYREKPLGVARPRHAADIAKLIGFACETGTPLIPRTAGTSLAGQVVGSGLVVDVSRYMTAILEFNNEEHLTIARILYNKETLSIYDTEKN